MDVLGDVLKTMRAGRPHAALTRSQAPWGVRFSTANAAGCHVILRGSCYLMADGSAPRVLTPGDVVFVPQQGTYALADRPDTPTVDFDFPDDADAEEIDTVELIGKPGAVTETLCAAYFLDRARMHPLLRDLPPVMHLSSAVGARSSLSKAVDLLGAELGKPQHGASVIVPALIDALLLLILREWIECQPSAERWGVALNDPLILPALRAIHSRPAKAWTVETLARESGISRATFAAKFRASVGMPPLTYLTWWRMTLAARELQVSSTTIASVASRVGYTSEFAFTKAFKRDFGVSPHSYRQNTAHGPR